jgi:hypothetical protein
MRAIFTRRIKRPLIIIFILLVAAITAGWLWLTADLPALNSMQVHAPSIRILHRKGGLHEVISDGRHTVVP